MGIDLNNLLLTLFGTFISTVAGAFFASWFFKKLEDQEIETMRKLATKFIKKDFRNSYFNKKTKTIIYKKQNWFNRYSKGEMNILDGFIAEITDSKYYEKKGNVKRSEYKKLLQEIKSGLWDYYLLLDKNIKK